MAAEHKANSDGGSPSKSRRQKNKNREIAGTPAANVSATTGVNIAAGGRVIAGQIIDGGTWGPVAAVCKALGIPYTWDATTKTMRF